VARGETRDIADEMMRVTLAIVGRTLFSKTWNTRRRTSGRR
jgi:hypothetical protein